MLALLFALDKLFAIVIILKKNVAGLTERGLQRFVALATQSVGIRTGVNVLVTSNRELQSLNRRFRGKDQPTDVLSFPAGAGTDDLGGDIAVSAEMARTSSRQLGHSAAQEVKILVLHGILHLAGYDHESDNGSMARKELRLRQRLKLPVGLIERHSETTARKKQPRPPGRKR